MIDEFIERLSSILPENNNKRYMGKEIDFSFVHPDTKVEFSPISLQQHLPGEVFQLSFEDCESECPVHEENLRKRVLELFTRLPDPNNGGLKICFRQFLFRKESFLNDMSVEEVIESIESSTSSVKLNSRNVQMLEDEIKLLEILKNLGAIQENEVKQADRLEIELQEGSVNVFFDYETFKLLKIKLRRVFGKELCIPCPSSLDQTEKNSGGFSLRPCANNKIHFEDLCHMTSDTSLLTILGTPGLGALWKIENQEKFVINRLNTSYVPFIFYEHSRIKYTFDLDGVKITLSVKSGVNHDFGGRVVSFVHQRMDREPRLKLQRKADQSTDHFVSVVVRVLFALKKVVQSKQLCFKMYDVEQESKRRYHEAVSQSPKWSLNSQQHKPQLSEEALEDFRRLQNEEDLPAMLGSPANAHPIALRAKARSLMEKINKILNRKNSRQLQQCGFDLAQLKQKLSDAASKRNLTL